MADVPRTHGMIRTHTTGANDFTSGSHDLNEMIGMHHKMFSFFTVPQLVTVSLDLDLN